MTQPYPPQYAPQQPPYYGAAPQPQAGPQGYPGAVVTYPPAQQPAPQPSGQGMVPPVPQLTQGGGGMSFDVSPKLRHLEGRTIVVIPISVNENAIDTETKALRPEATFDLLVCDGGELFYGDNVDDRNPQKNRPNTHAIQTPCLFRGATDIGKYFVVAVREALDLREPGRVGVVERGTKGFRPFLITRPDEHVDRSPRANGDQLFALGMKIFADYWNAKHGGAQVTWPVPRSLVVAPPQAAPQVNYGQPYATPAQPAQPAYAPQPAYAQPAPPAYGYGPQAPAQPSYAPVSAPANGAPFYGMQAPPQSAPPAAAPPAALPDPVAQWIASFPPEQQEAQRQAYLAHQAQQGAQPAPTGPGI